MVGDRWTGERPVTRERTEEISSGCDAQLCFLRMRGRENAKKHRTPHKCCRGLSFLRVPVPGLSYIVVGPTHCHISAVIYGLRDEEVSGSLSGLWLVGFWAFILGFSLSVVLGVRRLKPDAPCEGWATSP
jgi:hypothetical protein